jgi:hypothetical protein
MSGKFSSVYINTAMVVVEVAEKNLWDNKAEVTTYFINDENMKNYPHIAIKIGNWNVKLA